MPKLIRLYIQSVAIGFGLSAGFLVMVLWLDLAGIGHLILGSSMGLVAAAMMFVFFGVLFAGVQFGLRIMMMADAGDGPKGGLRQHSQPVPVRVGATARLPRRR